MHRQIWTTGADGIDFPGTAQIFRIRDVVFAEDHQNAYLGAAAHAMALFRNLAIGLIRLPGHTQIKRTLQRIAADRTWILPLLAASRP